MEKINDRRGRENKVKKRGVKWDVKTGRERKRGKGR